MWMTPPSSISSPSTSTGASIQPAVRSASLGSVGSPNRLRKLLLDFLTHSKSERVATAGMEAELMSTLSLEETRGLSMAVEENGDQWEERSKINSTCSMCSAWSTSEGGVGSSTSNFMEMDTESEDGSVLPLVCKLEEDFHLTSPLNEQV